MHPCIHKTCTCMYTCLHVYICLRVCTSTCMWYVWMYKCWCVKPPANNPSSPTFRTELTQAPKGTNPFKPHYLQYVKHTEIKNTHKKTTETTDLFLLLKLTLCRFHTCGTDKESVFLKKIAPIFNTTSITRFNLACDREMKYSCTG